MNNRPYIDSESNKKTIIKTRSMSFEVTGVKLYPL